MINITSLSKVVSNSQFWKEFYEVLQEELELFQEYKTAKLKDIFDYRELEDTSLLLNISDIFGYPVDLTLDETLGYLRSEIESIAFRKKFRTTFKGYQYSYRNIEKDGEIFLIYFTNDNLLRSFSFDTGERVKAIFDPREPFLLTSEKDFSTYFPGEIFYDLTDFNYDDAEFFYDVDFLRKPTKHVAVEYFLDKIQIQTDIPEPISFSNQVSHYPMDGRIDDRGRFQLDGVLTGGYTNYIDLDWFEVRSGTTDMIEVADWPRLIHLRNQTNLQSFYPFNDDLEDNSYNIFDGTNFGCTFEDNSTKGGKSLYTSGSEYATIPYSIQDGLYCEGGRRWTLHFKAFIPSTTTSGILIGQTDSAVDAEKNFELSVTSATEMQIIVRGTATTLTIPRDTWTSVAFVWNGNNLRLYIDGVFVQPISSGSATKEVITSTGIFATVSGDRILQEGYIDDLRIYNADLNSWLERIELLHDYHEYFCNSPLSLTIRAYVDSPPSVGNDRILTSTYSDDILPKGWFLGSKNGEDRLYFEATDTDGITNSIYVENFWATYINKTPIIVTEFIPGERMSIYIDSSKKAESLTVGEALEYHYSNLLRIGTHPKEAGTDNRFSGYLRNLRVLVQELTTEDINSLTFNPNQVETGFLINDAYLQFLRGRVSYNKRVVELPHVGSQLTCITDSSGYFDSFEIGAQYTSEPIKMRTAINPLIFDANDIVRVEVGTGFNELPSVLDELPFPSDLDQPLYSNTLVGEEITRTDDNSWLIVETMFEIQSQEDIISTEATSLISETLSKTPIQRRSLKINYTIGGDDYEATDTADGNIEGPFITELLSTINYNSGDIVVEFTTPTDVSLTTVSYTYASEYKETSPDFELKRITEAGLFDSQDRLVAYSSFAPIGYNDNWFHIGLQFLIKLEAFSLGTIFAGNAGDEYADIIFAGNAGDEYEDVIVGGIVR